jgi:hypothetical protein
MVSAPHSAQTAGCISRGGLELDPDDCRSDPELGPELDIRALRAERHVGHRPGSFIKPRLA